MLQEKDMYRIHWEQQGANIHWPPLDKPPITKADADILAERLRRDKRVSNVEVRVAREE